MPKIVFVRASERQECRPSVPEEQHSRINGTMSPNEEIARCYEEMMATVIGADPLRLVVFDVRGNGDGF
jgi:hypothetical protein